MNMFEVLKTEFDLQNDYITKGAIIEPVPLGTKEKKAARGKKSSRKIFKEDESS